MFNCSNCNLEKVCWREFDERWTSHENPENESNVELSETGEKLLKCPLQDHPDEFYFYTKDTFRKLVELATFDSYFFFNGDIFQQVDGVAMGSPLGPTLANIFMNHMEKKWLQNAPWILNPHCIDGMLMIPSYFLKMYNM